MQDAHVLGECRPCAYFWHKDDGCRWGDDCQFCHICDGDAIKRLKKAKRQRMKAQTRAEPLDEVLPLQLGREELPDAELLEPVRVGLRVELRPPPGLTPRPYFSMELLNQCMAKRMEQKNADGADAHLDGKLGYLVDDDCEEPSRRGIFNEAEMSSEAYPQLPGPAHAVEWEAPKVDALDPAFVGRPTLRFEDMFPELWLRSLGAAAPSAVESL